MKGNAVVFLLRSFSLECFSGKFGEIWAKILRTRKNLPAPTPMLVVVISWDSFHGRSSRAVLLKLFVLRPHLKKLFSRRPLDGWSRWQ